MSTQENFKHITVEEFSELDFNNITLLDLREPDEVLVSGIEGAINIPFSGGYSKLDTIPKNKPVVAFCREGDWSEQVAEILADRYGTSEQYEHLSVSAKKRDSSSEV